VLALRFADIEWFAHELRVRHAISKQRSRDGAHKWEWRLGPPKSAKSVRRIAATESVMRLLADLKTGAQAEFLFPGGCVGFIDPDKFDAEIWPPIAERAGMKGTRFHDLRHFFASQLIANGETAAYVRDQMGHSSIKVTFVPTGICSQDVAGRPVAVTKNMEAARLKPTAEVSNALAMTGEEGAKAALSN
jgi:integrase